MRRRQAVLAGAAIGVLALAAAGSGTGPGAGPGPGIAARPGWAAAPALSISPGARVSAAADSPAGVGLTPAQIRTAYDLDPLLARGISGRGQTIVIVDSFGSPTIGRDLTGFDQAFGLPPPPAFTVIQPAGVVPPYRATSNREGWATETTLDVEWAHVMAPAARILLAETPTSENEGTTGFPQIVAAEEYVLRNHLGQVISQSFAATEQTFPSRASLLSLRAAYRLASARHVTVLAATGDTGATGETYNMRDLYTSRAVQWPATDPLVTAVGGTQLDLTSSGVRRRPDIAWSDGGGGRSIVFARPAYQDGVAGVTGSRRGVPDIAMDASCASGVAIYASFGGTGPEHWDGVCGTSLATPLLAGVVALADQVAGHPLGLINPALYRMLAHHERGLTDILTGSNSMTFDQGGTEHTVAGFSARRGYDLVSGTGTIDARYFVPELARAAGRDRDADRYQDQSADLLAPLAGLPAEPGPQLQAGQRQRHADTADHQDPEEDGRLIGTERESHHQVVQAEGQAGQQQPPRAGAIAAVRGHLGSPPAQRPDQPVDADRDQQSRPDPASGQAELGGELAADEQADDGHARLEGPEHQADPQPGPGIDARDSDAEGSGEVRQPDRSRDKEEREHSRHVSRGSGPAGSGQPGAGQAVRYFSGILPCSCTSRTRSPR
jgi:hypothetical protein